MNLTRLKKEIKFAVAQLTEIKTVKVGYLQELNTGQTAFDCLLLLPPKLNVSDPNAENDSLKYDLHYFIIRLNKNTEGKEFTEDEHIAAWDDLVRINTVITDAMRAAPWLIKIISGITTDLNAGGVDGGNILADAVIWIEVQYTIDTSECVDHILSTGHWDDEAPMEQSEVMFKD